jgi:SAM-dependent methyltransferase
VNPPPEAINGDLPLTSELRRAYMAHHAGRNRANARRSRELRIATAPIPLPGTRGSDLASPARVMVSAFFAHAAKRLWKAYRGAGEVPAITVLDIGCGAGNAVLPFLESAGFRGRYIGLDISPHRAWASHTSATFTRELIVDDVHTLDVRRLPPIDVLVSATALEHIRDDAGSLARLAARLTPHGAQIHYVPGEAALPLYGPHGWRQYSPACLRRLFPNAELFRAGGACSSALHARAIPSDGSRGLRERRPRLYRVLRQGSLLIDRLAGNSPATMYGVLVMPSAPQFAGIARAA